ncbi:unnamed protein product [Staurois parvus]|uniref:Uncharacterized protein n=1 Tax=Staurois parvus TaxID=386267 RepID=A0ABN9CX38_9NEOB|nr:unnamed protein product [Staurois parvus]
MISATHQCCQSVSSINAVTAHHCCISVQHHQCLLINAYQCHPICAAYQCPSVQPHQRTSVKEKKYLFA